MTEESWFQDDYLSNTFLQQDWKNRVEGIVYANFKRTKIVNEL